MIVETSSGRIRGTSTAGVHSFRGVPYAADTAGMHRFQAPRPVSWAGIRDALAPGPRSPQHEPASTAPWRTWLHDPAPAGEDCLVLNVYTASFEERRPVMVYLHGGGFAIGSSGSPGLDGGNLARRGAVVVTLNHRLNLFGHLHLAGLDGERYADSGNAGLLDIVAALRWVRENIAQFGGDPGKVTIFGQSGGGSKVAALMAMPAARGLFHRAIIQSASSLLALATPEEAQRNTHHFLAQLGLDRTRVSRLHEIAMHDLLRAMPEAIRAAGAIDDFRPVVDGRTVVSQPFDPAALELSRDIPLMTGWCENEQRLTLAATPSVYEWSRDEATAALAQVLETDLDAAARLMRAYGEQRPHDSPGDLYAQIFGDHRYRRSVTRAAELKAADGGAPAFMYLFRWKSPVAGGLLRTPHTLCIPFAFANVDRATGLLGTGTDRHALQEQVAQAWLAFARGGDPNHPGLPDWKPYDAVRRSTMVFDTVSRAQDDPLREERLAFASYPAYVPSRGEGRLR